MYEVLSLTSTEHLKPLLCYEIRKPIQYSKLLFDKYMYLGGELGPIMILGPLQILKKTDISLRTEATRKCVVYKDDYAFQKNTCFQLFY